MGNGNGNGNGEYEGFAEISNSRVRYFWMMKYYNIYIYYMDGICMYVCMCACIYIYIYIYIEWRARQYMGASRDKRVLI